MTITPIQINRTVGSSTYFYRYVGKKAIDKAHIIVYICTKIMDIMVTKQKIITAFTYVCILFLGFALGNLITDNADKQIKKLDTTTDRVEAMMLRFELIDTKLDQIKDKVLELQKSKKKRKK